MSKFLDSTGVSRLISLFKNALKESLNKGKQDGVTGATGNRYAVCYTGGSAAAKTASVTAGTPTLEAGLHVFVNFFDTNLAGNPTLNINNTGARAIFYNGEAITTQADILKLIDGVCEFVYDGAQWHLVNKHVEMEMTARDAGAIFNSVFYPPVLEPITYTASAKLVEVTGWGNGLHTNAFDANIVSHTFENGVGTIGFDAPITEIGDSAFYGCTDLTGITIPSSVTSIGDDAFYESGLTSITIPNNVTSIGYRTIFACSSLTSAAIGSGVTSIGGVNFVHCSHLASLSVDTQNTVYDSRNSCNAIIETATNKLVAGCNNTVIPNDVTEIAEHAFNGRASLTSIVIPSGVSRIDNFAFDNCTNLTSVTCKATTPPEMGWGIFSHETVDRKIYVPAASVDAYKASSSWSDYASEIEAIPV